MRPILWTVNPVAKLAAATLLLAALFVSLDGVTAGIVLLGLLAILPISGLAPSSLARRFWLVGIAALSIGIFNVLFAGEQVGPVVLEIGPLRIGAATLANGAGLALRLFAIALAGALATLTSEPIDVADALIQQVRVSPRFAIGVLAALRLLPLLDREWQVIGMARRARGVDAGGSPIEAVRLAFGRLFALMVAAIRRGSRLAVAMEARGFGARPCRSVARPQRMRTPDWLWIAGAAALAAVAIGVSLAVGTWRPLFG